MAKFNLFNVFSRSSNKKDKGVTKKEAAFDGKYGFADFFRFYGRNFNPLVKANLIFALLCFPLVLMIIPFSGMFNTEAYMPTNMIYPVIQGIAQYGSNAVIDAYTAIYGGTTTVSVWSQTSYILFYCGGLLIFSFGFANVGLAYITRAAVRRKHIDTWYDFFYAIKKNFRQALVVGIIDFAVSGILIYDLLAYNRNRTEFYLQMFFFFIILIALFWIIMRAYIYPMMVTFDLSIYKLIKNALIFAVLGIKRNVFILLGGVAAFLFTFYSIFLMSTVGYILPFIFTISFICFLSTYCAWPVIDKYMIKPYYPDEDKNDDDDVTPVFTDRG